MSSHGTCLPFLPQDHQRFLTYTIHVFSVGHGHAQTLTNKNFLQPQLNECLDMPAIVAELSLSANTVVFILTFTLMVTYALKSEKN